MRPCRPAHHSLRPSWALLPVVLLVLCGTLACTTDARIEPTADAAMNYEGKSVTWEKLLDYAEFRQDVIGARAQNMQWRLLDATYKANPIPIPQEHIDYQFNRLYRQFAPGGASLAEGEKAFKKQYKIGTVIPEDRFEFEIMVQPRLEALLMQEHPVTDQMIRDQFDMMTQETIYQMFGQGLGLTEPRPITFDEIRVEFRATILQQTLNPYATEYLNGLVAKAESEGRLEVNRLPGEVPPADPTAATESETDSTSQPLPSSLAQAAERLKADREAKSVKPGHSEKMAPEIAYTLDGVPVTWKDILSDSIAQISLRRHTQTLASIIAIDYAFEKEGMHLDMALYDLERDRMIRSIGGEEQMQTTLSNMSVSNDMFEDQIRREVKLRQLLLAAYPIKEETLRERYASMQPDQWYQVYQPILGLKSESEATYGRIREQLYQDAVNNTVSEKKQGYLDTLLKLLKDRRILLVAPDPMLPEMSPKPLDLPQPIINGLPRLPFAAETVSDALHLPKSKVHIPVSDTPAAEGQPAADHAGGDDGHGH